MSRVTTGLAAALLATSALAEPTTAFHLDAALTYGHGETSAGRMHSLLEVRPELETAFSDTTTLVASLRLRLDADDDIEPNRPDYDSYWGPSRPTRLGSAGSLELRDAYLAFAIPNGVMRIGKQQVVWGKLDGLKVLDVVNPQDFRYFIVEDFADSRLTLWSAYADFNLGDWRTEVVVVPDSSGHVIPDPGAWFELRAPRFRFGANASTPATPTRAIAPSSGFDDTGFGLRVSRDFGLAVISGVAHSGRDPEPLGRIVLDAGGPVVVTELERRDTLGLSADIGLGAAVVRFEIAQHPDRWFNTREPTGLERVRRDQTRTAIGVDVNGPFESLINVQYLDDRVDGPNDTLVRPLRDRIVTAAFRKTLGFDRWEFQARWYRSLTDRDSMASLKIQHAVNDQTALALEVVTFRGDPGGLFGQFETRDLATLRVTHSFR